MLKSHCISKSFIGFLQMQNVSRQIGQNCRIFLLLVIIVSLLVVNSAGGEDSSDFAQLVQVGWNLFSYCTEGLALVLSSISSSRCTRLFSSSMVFGTFSLKRWLKR